MLIKRFLRCQGDSSGQDAPGLRRRSVPEGWKKLPQEKAGEDQECQWNTQEEKHLEKCLPTAEGIGWNQIAHRILPRRRLLAPPLAALTFRIYQGLLPNEG